MPQHNEDQDDFYNETLKLEQSAQPTRSVTYGIVGLLMLCVTGLALTEGTFAAGLALAGAYALCPVMLLLNAILARQVNKIRHIPALAMNMNAQLVKQTGKHMKEDLGKVASVFSSAEVNSPAQPRK